MCLRRKTVVDKYDELMKEQQFIMDTISNLGREKDYKVQKWSELENVRYFYDFFKSRENEFE